MAQVTNRVEIYKEHTAKVVTWIVETAIRVCRDDQTARNILASLRTPAPGERWDVPRQDIIDLAQAILDNRVEVVQIPRDIMASLGTAIRERQAEHRERRSTTGMRTEADQAHLNFIATLRDNVLIIFNSIIANARSADAVNTINARNRQGALKRRHSGTPTPYEAARRGDHFPGFDRSPGASASPEPEPEPEPTAVADSFNNFSLGGSTDDPAFPLWCHLDDMRNIRNFVKYTWCRYMDITNSSFVLPSIITEAAISQLRFIDDEFVKKSPDLAEYDKVLQFLTKNDYSGQGGYPDIKMNPLSETIRSERDLQAPVDPKAVDLLCLESLEILQLHKRQCERLTLRERDKAAGVQTPAGTMLPSLNIRLSQLLSQNILALVSPSRRDPKAAIIDEFIQALGHRNNRLNRTWLISACQIYRDMLDILGDKASTGVTQLQETIKEYVEAAKRNTNWRDGELHETCTWLQEVAQSLQGAKFRSQTVLFDRGDVFNQHFEAHEKKKRMKYQCEWLTGLENEFPTQAGSSLYRLQASLLSKGCQAANDDFSVHAAAYLYVALRFTGLMTTTWPEMDRFLATQQANGPFVPDYTSLINAQQILTAYINAVGRHVKTTTRNVSYDVSNGKEIRIGIPFHAELLRGSKQKDWNSRHLVSSSRLVDVALNQRPKGERPTSVDLLDAIGEAFDQEKDVFDFPYLDFWWECARAVNRIRWEIRDRHDVRTTKTDAEVVFDILTDMVAAHTRADFKGSYLGTAADILIPYVAEHGD